MIIFANTETARQITKELYPEAKNVRFIEHGYDNLVGLVNDQYALRFPRNEYAHLRDQYEKLVLLDLASLQDISIPKILGEGQNPPYVITSFVSGEHIAENEIDQWPVEQQKRFAEQVAKFAFSMHSLLSTKKALEDQKKVGLNDFNYYEYSLSNYTFPTPEQDKIAKDYYNRWKNLQDTSAVVIHNDLQTMNLLFENGELVGVIDFGDAKVGTPEQELRQMYRINEFVLQSVVSKYEQLSGQELNIEDIKIWAIIQELAAYADKLSANKIAHPGFSRAAKHLQKWLPDGNWEQLLKDNNHEISSKQ